MKGQTKIKKAFYYVVTSQGTWGRSVNLKDAILNAGIKKISLTESKQKPAIYIYTGLVDFHASKEVIQNLCNCFYYDDGGYCVNICEDLTQEDREQIEKYFLGWIVSNDLS